MTEYTLEASVKLGMIEYALVASVDPCGSLLAEGIAECYYTGPQPVTGLKLDIKKSEFAFSEVKYLGFIISAKKGIKIDSGKVKAIKK
jgi:hypothetical protein